MIIILVEVESVADPTYIDEEYPFTLIVFRDLFEKLHFLLDLFLCLIFEDFDILWPELKEIFVQFASNLTTTLCIVPEWQIDIFWICVHEDVGYSIILTDDIVLIVQVEALNCVACHHFKISIFTSELVKACRYFNTKRLKSKI